MLMSHLHKHCLFNLNLRLIRDSEHEPFRFWPRPNIFIAPPSPEVGSGLFLS